MRWRSGDAWIRGRLYEGPGFPLLEVPAEDILAYGTANYLADVATQARLSDWMGSRFPTRPGKGHSGRLGRRVRGATLLRRPPNPACPPSTVWRGFGRALPASIGGCSHPPTVNGARELAWVYTVEETGIKGRRIVCGCWPE